MYQEKSQFLDNHIESAQEYFSNYQNLKNPNQMVNNIRKQVDQINKRIE